MGFIFRIPLALRFRIWAKLKQNPAVSAALTQSDCLQTHKSAYDVTLE